MSKILYYKNGHGVHVGGPFSDHSLCGDTLEGDPGFDIEPEAAGGHMLEISAQRITCKLCREALKYCRRVDAAQRKHIERHLTS